MSIENGGHRLPRRHMRHAIQGRPPFSLVSRIPRKTLRRKSQGGDEESDVWQRSGIPGDFARGVNGGRVEGLPPPPSSPKARQADQGTMKALFDFQD